MSELAKVTRAEPRGMISLRGDLASETFEKTMKSVTGLAIPKAGTIAGDGVCRVLWMSPDELLVLLPYDGVAQALNRISEDLSKEHHLAVDVSDARAVFQIAGDNAHEVLAKVCPVDLHRDSFAVGDMRRSRLAQVAAAFWRHETGFDLVCFRSVSDYAEGVLRIAASGAATGALGR